MTAEEYFGDWSAILDRGELSKIMRWLNKVNSKTLCPTLQNIFKAFRLCPYKDCKVIMLGQDPYPQKGIATGILFGNSADTPESNLSPSLRVVKEAAVNYEIPHKEIIFDNTLESWARQGILMINSALTCELNKVGSHFSIWQPFISKFLTNVSIGNPGLIYVLFGNQAQSFKSCIKSSFMIIESYHPAFYARQGTKLPYSIFLDINKGLKDIYNSEIKFYTEVE